MNKNKNYFYFYSYSYGTTNFHKWIKKILIKIIFIFINEKNVDIPRFFMIQNF